MEANVPNTPPEGDWRQQARMMAVTTANPVQEDRAAKGSSALVRRQMLGIVILTVAIATGMGLYFAGADTGNSASDSGSGLPIVLIPAVAVAMIGAMFVSSSIRKSVKVSNDWLAPLGLKVTSTPRVVARTYDYSGRSIEGPTIMNGQRHGRAVMIVIDVKHYETAVEGRFPDFTVTSTASGLVASPGAPAPVREVIDPLHGERWTRLSLTAGPEGIRVRRKVRSDQFKESLWLTDLWLAERLSAVLTRR